MGQADDAPLGDVGGGEPRAVGGVQLDLLVFVAQHRAVGGARDLELVGAVEPPEGAQVESVLHRVEVEDRVAFAVFREDEDIGAVAARQGVTAGAVEQDVIAVAAAQPLGAGSAGDQFPDRTEIDRELGHPGGEGPGSQHVELVADHRGFEPPDPAQRHPRLVLDGGQLEQSTARQQGEQGEPAITAGGQNVDPLADADCFEQPGPGEAGVGAIDHVVGEGQGAARGHREDGERGGRSAGGDQVALPAALHRREGGGHGQPHPLPGAERETGFGQPVGAEPVAQHAVVGLAGGEEVADVAAGKAGQGGDVMLAGARRIAVPGAAQAAALGPEPVSAAVVDPQPRLAGMHGVELGAAAALDRHRLGQRRPRLGKAHVLRRRQSALRRDRQRLWRGGGAAEAHEPDALWQVEQREIRGHPGDGVAADALAVEQAQPVGLDAQRGHAHGQAGGEIEHRALRGLVQDAAADAGEKGCVGVVESRDMPD